MDEIAAMNAFEDMHERLQVDAMFNYDFLLKKYGKDYLCSIKHLEEYMSSFENIIEKERRKAKKEILEKGMLSKGYMLDGHEEGATEDDICEMAKILETSYHVKIKSFSKYRDQKLYYNHVEHCKVQREHFLELKKK